MKTIPSLVASSTVGVAAAGLALGKPDHSSPKRRPSSKKRKSGDVAADGDNFNLGTPSLVSRPATSSTMVTPESRNTPSAMGSSSTTQSSSLPFLRRPSHLRIDSPTQNGAARRWSLIRAGDAQSDNFSDESGVRDSVSSRGSWIRRLSIPISGNSSPRSSIAPESPSITFSHTSAAPILSSPRDSPTQLPPNKLVKRQTSERIRSGTVSSESKAQARTLRRPATSHQRTITLQQRFIEDSPGTKTQSRPTPPRRSTVSTQRTPLRKHSESPRSSWRMYFDSRPTKFSKERSSGRSTDGNMHNFFWTSKRVMPDHTARPTLVKPSFITVSTSEIEGYYDEEGLPCDGSIDFDEDDLEESSSPLVEENKRPRRSLSMHFSSPGTWITRSGSLRNKKRNMDTVRKSNVPDPVSSAPRRVSISAHGPTPNHTRPMMDQTIFQRPASSWVESSSPIDPFSPVNFNPRNRNTSSPLPPLTRLSTFNVDISRLGLSSSSSSGPMRSPSSPFPMSTTAATSFSTNAASTSSSSPYYGSLSSKPKSSEVGDRASTLIGSDNEMRSFASGDDDDLDFQSETVYDSIRSGATSSLRSQGTPLDSMFDDSPPTTTLPPKAKRLSIHELMANGAFSDIENKIIEEDEGQATPVKLPKVSQTSDHGKVAISIDTDLLIPSSPPTLCLSTKEFGHLSLGDEDDEDEDWTRDDEDENFDIASQLSPPTNSSTCRRVSAIIRPALADVTYGGSTNGNPERPRSNVFEWSESTTADKDFSGISARPRTAHVKHLADGRGGRTVGRKGPSPMHIRSQSVPVVVPDLIGQREHPKLTPKFGTWGLGAKGVSEDWDNDFDFDASDDGEFEAGKSSTENKLMFVPPAIQASQANVVGHVGQIREVCLLVEDLKRLRFLAREHNLLNGPSAQLWKEAEGIIALAVPEEEDPTLSPPHSPTSPTTDAFSDKFFDHGSDGEDIATPDTPFEVLGRHGKGTGYVYDGNLVRRRSVFSPEDDIFGTGAIVHNPPLRDALRPPAILVRHSSAKTSAEVARTVMETMHQHRSTSDPMLSEMINQSSNKMPFDTTSLRDLVHRAGVLTRKLSEIIREAEGPIQSPQSTPHRDSSPAFTRVFTDPKASPPQHLLRSHSNNSVLSSSVNSSPTRSLGQRMHMMTVV
ncbi:Splicing coactivator SRm160 300 protein [Rutstroemia sp. NJR-2017a WRK4]|nr:Splicing coactivator SRm160 300 protein [Rutstroemia sp. NJR-2017a WRK4]